MSNRILNQPDSHLPPAQHGGMIDLETVLPLELIREHTKTDDVPSVSDAQLQLYRRAATEAAEQYTGLVLASRKVITEDVELPRIPHTNAWQQYRPQQTFKHYADYPFAENFVWFYGVRNTSAQQVRVQKGATVVDLPTLYYDFGLDCCREKKDSAVKIQYVTGADCAREVPANFILGALKYIAHVIENPGDVVVATQQGGGRNTTVGVDAAANPAWASGAIELWRVIKADAI